MAPRAHTQMKGRVLHPSAGLSPNYFSDSVNAPVAAATKTVEANRDPLAINPIWRRPYVLNADTNPEVIDGEKNKRKICE
jgi:hypothetical protein